MRRLNGPLNEEDLRQFLAEREVGNVVRFYRSLRAPGGGEPKRLGSLRKESLDSYTVEAGVYNEGAADTEATVRILEDIAPSRFDYEGPETRL